MARFNVNPPKTNHSVSVESVLSRFPPLLGSHLATTIQEISKTDFKNLNENFREFQRTKHHGGPDRSRETQSGQGSRLCLNTPKLLKLAAAELAPPLTKIYNSCINQGAGLKVGRRVNDHLSSRRTTS